MLFAAACGDSTLVPSLDQGHDFASEDLGNQDEDLGVDLVTLDMSVDVGIDDFDYAPVVNPLGGQATIASVDAPFATLIGGLELSHFQQVSRGREFFVADWEPNDSGRELLNGLGPLFHVASCVGCHPASGRPPSILGGGSVGPGLLVRLRRVSEGSTIGNDPVYGGQFQPLATTGVPVEGRVRWKLTDGRPVTFIDNLGYGPLNEQTRLGPRLSPQIGGMGLLDRIPASQILEREDPQDMDGDGVSGRANWQNEAHFGRYGWKADVMDLETQIAEALRSDMGLTSHILLDDDCTESQTECLATPSGGDPEVDSNAVSAMAAYLHMLGVPGRRKDNLETQKRGFKTFVSIGCEACHRSTFQTQARPDDPFGDQTIHPFSDLLLHDMGDDLSDGIPVNSASGSEWRTPPLWGIGRVAEDPLARFLHDGRASSLEEAIVFHGGEALSARQRYEALDEDARRDLMEFLNSL